MSKSGDKKPMYGKTKFSEFLAHQSRKLFGAENPMYGKKNQKVH
jgi:hypothetical protein